MADALFVVAEPLPLFNDKGDTPLGQIHGNSVARCREQQEEKNVPEYTAQCHNSGFRIRTANHMDFRRLIN